MNEISRNRPRRKVPPEYVLIGILVLVGIIAVPAAANVYLIQSVIVSLCAGLGIPVR